MTHRDPVASARLARLEGYLREDPRNAQLLADLFDAALAAGETGRADDVLARARDARLEGPDWDHRAAHLALARGAWAEALALLQRVRVVTGDNAALAHDSAYAQLRLGEFASCAAALAPWLEREDLEIAVLAPLQALGLRAAHQQGALEEGFAWAQAQANQGRLSPVAAGVASLLAVDLGRFGAARTLAEEALRAGAAPPEALVARACVALADKQTTVAEALLQQALALHAADGRTWSALGMAALQARDFGAAQGRFARAAGLMPAHVGTWHGLGWARLLLGETAGALQAFGEALALDRNFAESHGALALALAAAGQGAQAAEHLDLADRLDRHNVTARYARALLAGDVRDADALNRLAVRLLDRPGLFGASLAAEALGPGA